MSISVCITTFNESKNDINDLFTSLNKQTLKPSEIIITDASNSKHKILNPKQIQNLRIINSKNTSRARGRNIAIKKAKNEIIAVTDVGCTLDKNWLKEMSKSFEKGGVDVVAGGYKMKYKNSFNKAVAKFLGVDYGKINSDFLPSARSLAFTKSIWKKAGGFPENLEDTAEDTVFNINLLNTKAKFKVNKKAFVYWNLNLNIKTFFKKIYSYALGDLKSGIWWHPVKKLKTHNLKVITILVRYILLFILFIFGYYNLFGLLVIGYWLFAFRKAGTWGIVLQFISDIAIITSLINYVFLKQRDWLTLF